MSMLKVSTETRRVGKRKAEIPEQVLRLEAAVARGDWRNQLLLGSRQRIVNKMMQTLERHLPFSGQEGLVEIMKIASRFEEKVYAAAVSQADYLRKISLKMLAMETTSKKKPMANSFQLSFPLTFAKTSLDTSQTVNVSGADWQEEIYQKIKCMNEAFFPDLNEMYQRTSAKLQQHDSLPQQPKNEQLEKLRFFKLMLERLIMFLKTNKNEIQPNHKEKIAGVQKQILNILSSNRPRKPGPGLQQGQISQSNMHPMQQSQLQPSQMHTNDGQMNLQMQPANVQGSTVTTQHNTLNNVQHSSLPCMSSVSNARQNMMDALQPGPNIESGQGNSLNQMHQVAMNSLQQNSVSSPQQMNISSMLSQGGMTMPSNVNPLQANSNILQPQQIKQEQQIFPTQQMKQHYQQRQMHPQFIRKQQLIQQTGQQQSSQLPTQQMMQQLNQMVSTDMKMRHQLGVKSGVLQQHGQRSSLDTSQTVNVSGADWQEEIYQKIKCMNEAFFPDLNEMYQRMSAKLQQHDSLPQQPSNEQLEKLRFFKLMLERLIMFLKTNKNEIQPNHKVKIAGVQKQILNILSSNRPRQPGPGLHQGQISQSNMHPMQQSQLQ